MSNNILPIPLGSFNNYATAVVAGSIITAGAITMLYLKRSSQTAVDSSPPPSLPEVQVQSTLPTTDTVSEIAKIVMRNQVLLNEWGRFTYPTQKQDLMVNCKEKTHLEINGAAYLVRTISDGSYIKTRNCNQGIYFDHREYLLKVRSEGKERTLFLSPVQS